MSSRPDTRLTLILALAVLVTFVFWPSAVVYAHEWQDFRNLTFTHGWLVLAVSVALLVRLRRAIAAAPLRPTPLALVALAAVVFAWLVCYRASVQDLHITILPLIFWLAVTAAFGLPVGLLVAFPVAFFYFAVPSLAQLGPPMQALTILAMRLLFSLTGPAVEIFGDVVETPNGLFRISAGCSGLHFMIVGLAIAALHGELRRDRWRIRVAQLALMACFALIANWLRVYTVIESGYLTNMRGFLITVGHYWFGWGIFALTLIPFFWLTARWSEPREAPPQVPPTTPAVSVASLVAATLVLVAPPLLSAAIKALQTPAPLRVTVTAAAPWIPVTTDALSAWQPTFPGADDEQQIAYQDGLGDVVETYRVAYAAQRQGAKLIGLGTSIAGQGQAVHSQAIVSTSVGKFREAQLADRSSARSLIWYRYQMGDRDFVKPLLGQLWYGMRATVSNPPAGLVAYRAPCGPTAGCADARGVLANFVTLASAP
jgi:exosortase